MQRHMRVGDDTSVMKEVWARSVWQQTMHEDDIPRLGHDGLELLAFRDMGAVVARERRIDSFWPIIQVFDNSCQRSVSRAGEEV